jgi:predicted small metal-binding protein
MPLEMKKIDCDPNCGFMVRSSDEKELIEVIIQHFKRTHNIALSERDAKAKIEPVRLDKNKAIIGY